MKVDRFQFTKMSGAGNDFLITDLTSAVDLAHLRDFFKGADLPEITRRICRPHTGVGADGVVFVTDLKEKNSETVLTWEFFNSDGSLAEMCGNAARCVAKWAVAKKQCQSPLVIQTLSGPVRAWVNENHVTVEMGPTKEEEWAQKETVSGQTVTFDHINSGVPHIVVRLENSSEFHQHIELARALRGLPRYQPRGCNITFYSPEGPSQIRSVSFERGVENFTLACGTGAVAAARSHHHHLKGAQDVVRVQVPGGELTVDFSDSSARLSGPAQFIAEVEIYPGI